MYFGGQGIVILLNSLSPGFLNMKNTLPDRLDLHSFTIPNCHADLPHSAGITTTGLIGFVLFIFVYFPVMYWVPAWRIQKLLEVQVVIATVTLLGIMGWAIHVSLSHKLVYTYS
jgi:NCS1 family nucleobase:cation symporter-1